MTTIGYPYSVSAYFRRANANMSRAESRSLVEQLHRETKAAGRKLVIYISMAFGNPYEEPWGPEIVEDALVWLKDVGVRIVSLADTVGTASPTDVADLYRAVKDASPESILACICTVVQSTPLKKCWRRMRRDAGDLMAR